MDHIELWDKAKALMREELANVSYTTWIEQPLKPVYVVDDKLALEVISDFNEKTIRARYLPMITEAVSQAAGREMTIELMSVKERIEWQERQKKEDAPAMQGINMFNPKSTFDTFVVGSSNRFAHAAALAVAEQPGMAYNPLFLYGGVGLGKTHLMHAIGHFIQDHFPNMRMLYLPSEMFTNELVAAIKNNKNVEFRNRFRNVDVLMLDEPLAAAIGADLPVFEPIGSMVVDIGGGTTDVAVLALGGIAASASVRTGGTHLDAAVREHVQKAHGVMVGERTAEEIKIALGNALPGGTERMQVRGRKLDTGLPTSLILNAGEVAHAIAPAVQRIVAAVKDALSETPPELAGDLYCGGITLMGGGAELRGLDRLISQETGMPVRVEESPLDCVALGALRMLDRQEAFAEAVHTLEA